MMRETNITTYKYTRNNYTHFIFQHPISMDDAIIIYCLNLMSLFLSIIICSNIKH